MIGRCARFDVRAQWLGFEIAVIPSRTIRLVVISLVFVCTAGCDQLSKHIARTELGQMGSATLVGRFIEFSLAENPGAFLGLGASFPQAARNVLTVGVGLGMGCLLVYLLRTPRLRCVSFVGLALILAGGISNLIDRFTHHGLVTDFIVLRVGPFHTGVFNLADFAIVIGILVLAATSHAGPRTQEAPSSVTGSSP